MRQQGHAAVCWLLHERAKEFVLLLEVKQERTRAYIGAGADLDGLSSGPCVDPRLHAMRSSRPASNEPGWSPAASLRPCQSSKIYGILTGFRRPGSEGRWLR